MDNNNKIGHNVTVNGLIVVSILAMILLSEIFNEILSKFTPVLHKGKD
jgi:hypothetical protein